MGYSEIISDLNHYLELGEKKKKVLQSLLISSRISQNTFDLMDKKLSHEISIVSDLREALEQEESFLKCGFSEETSILESILIDLELRRLLSQIGDEEYNQKSKIINSGLDSLKNNGTSTNMIMQQDAPPIQTTLKEHIGEENMSQLEDKQSISQQLEEHDEVAKQTDNLDIINVEHPIEKRENRFTKEPPHLEKSLVKGVHCMNPWKRECRNTDIKLSIYYQDRMTPLCRRCWEEISEKNMEWTSL